MTDRLGPEALPAVFRDSIGSGKIGGLSLSAITSSLLAQLTGASVLI